jgi:hypothetical protein
MSPQAVVLRVLMMIFVPHDLHNSIHASWIKSRHFSALMNAHRISVRHASGARVGGIRNLLLSNVTVLDARKVDNGRDGNFSNIGAFFVLLQIFQLGCLQDYFSIRGKSSMTPFHHSFDRQHSDTAFSQNAALYHLLLKSKPTAPSLRQRSTQRIFKLFEQLQSHHKRKSELQQLFHPHDIFAKVGPLFHVWDERIAFQMAYSTQRTSNTPPFAMPATPRRSHKKFNINFASIVPLACHGRTFFWQTS